MERVLIYERNEAMNIRGMKQVDLVEKTGIGKSAINHYVSGKYEAKQKALYLLAQALDVDEAWLTRMMWQWIKLKNLNTLIIYIRLKPGRSLIF